MPLECSGIAQVRIAGRPIAPGKIGVLRPPGTRLSGSFFARVETPVQQKLFFENRSRRKNCHAAGDAHSAALFNLSARRSFATFTRVGCLRPASATRRLPLKLGRRQRRVRNDRRGGARGDDDIVWADPGTDIARVVGEEVVAEFAPLAAI